MRIAIFSDVHGNLTALKAVLAHIEQQSPDIIAFAGDLCLFGPRPAACLDLVRQRGIPTVYGNTDEWILTPPVAPPGASDKARAHWLHLNEISHWTQSKLAPAELAWLDSLTFEHRISPTSNTKDDLLVVHANPLDVSQVIFPSDSDQKHIFGDIQQSQTDADLAPLLEGVTANVVAFGHLHVPNVRRWRNLTLANISSVSLPGDGDPRAKYALLTWNKHGGWSVEHQRVPYEIKDEQEALASLRPPRWESYARRLENPAT